MYKLLILTLVSLNASASSVFPTPCKVMKTLMSPATQANYIGQEPVGSDCAPGNSYGVVAFTVNSDGKVVTTILKSDEQKSCFTTDAQAKQLLAMYRSLGVCL